MKDFSVIWLLALVFVLACVVLYLLLKVWAEQEARERAELRAEVAKEAMALMSKELGEVREVAEYRARLLQKMPAGPVSLRPVGARVESASYLVRPVVRVAKEGEA